MSDFEIKGIEWLSEKSGFRSIIPMLLFLCAGACFLIVSGALAIKDVSDAVFDNRKLLAVIAVIGVVVSGQAIMGFVQVPLLHFLEGYNWEKVGLRLFKQRMSQKYRSYFMGQRDRLR